MKPINYTLGNRTAESKATLGEIAQLRSVNGSMGCAAVQAREGIYLSKLQSIVNVAKVKHETANHTLQEMKNT